MKHDKGLCCMYFWAFLALAVHKHNSRLLLTEKLTKANVFIMYEHKTIDRTRSWIFQRKSWNFFASLMFARFHSLLPLNEKTQFRKRGSRVKRAHLIKWLSRKSGAIFAFSRPFAFAIVPYGIIFLYRLYIDLTIVNRGEWAAKHFCMLPLI